MMAFIISRAKTKIYSTSPQEGTATLPSHYVSHLPVNGTAGQKSPLLKGRCRTCSTEGLSPPIMSAKLTEGLNHSGRCQTKSDREVIFPKITITTFTDPMMGLSWEYEPTFRKLETHFSGKIEFRYIMSVLVPDVYRLVNCGDLNVSEEFALKNYNERLAKIYESEEAISGMPINMNDFHLFSVEHTSSRPLNLAYKAVQLIDRSKANLFLYNLRYATVFECRQTTKLDEILEVVKKTEQRQKRSNKNFNRV